MKKIDELHCPNCGAPVTTEICPYCKVRTGLDTKDADMEYPVIDCKEAILNFWNTIFPGIFAFGFGLSGITSYFMLNSFEKNFDSFMSGFKFFPIPFITIGLIALIIVIVHLRRYLLVKSFGKEIKATVYGYMDDNLYINGNPAQIVKLLVDTNEGKRFILYQLKDIKKPYKVNSTIDLVVYKNYFLISKKNKNYFN